MPAGVKGIDPLTFGKDKHSEVRRQHLPDAAAMLCLQGKLFQAYREAIKAIDCYAEALKLNPFMWDAFLGLCDLGMVLAPISRMIMLKPRRCKCTNIECFPN